MTGHRWDGGVPAPCAFAYCLVWCNFPTSKCQREATEASWSSRLQGLGLVFQSRAPEGQSPCGH